MKCNSAMIFAAGFGTRMGKLTSTTPKPMLPLGGRPMIDHCIDLLQEAGIETLVANTHYFPATLEKHLKGRGVIPLREHPILETGGGLRAALPHLGSGPVITMNPDAIWVGSNPIQSLIAAWDTTMSALLVLSHNETANSDLRLEHGEIQRRGPVRFTGLQILRTERLDEIAETAFSLNRYWDLMMASGPLHGLVYSGLWEDIGTEEKLAAANQRLSS